MPLSVRGFSTYLSGPVGFLNGFSSWRGPLGLIALPRSKSTEQTFLGGGKLLRLDDCDNCDACNYFSL